MGQSRDDDHWEGVPHSRCSDSERLRSSKVKLGHSPANSGIGKNLRKKTDEINLTANDLVRFV